MLEVNEVSKSFGGLMAVYECSLRVEEGTITGLIGPNGAGKTTLFNVITGNYKPDKGQITFLGENISGLPPHQIFKKKMYRTFQITREFGTMTVLENLMYMPEGQVGEKVWNTWFRNGTVRRQEKEIREKALEVLEFVELINLKDEYAGSLSGGQKKLLELARSMMADPKMVLLDEPAAGVNRTLLGKLVANIRKLCGERGITFFLVEHNMDLVMNLCNPVIVMSEGRKLAEGTPEEIKKDKSVLEAYLGGQYR
jgi:branched-chain amino acid transport system ATP-binding protein